VKVDFSVECLVGCYCSHAVLTDKIGVYRCPFGACFKKQESQK
jgi:CxxC motif-containing protein